MGDTAASKARCFCVLFVVHAAQVLSRTVTLALLIAILAGLGGAF